MAVPNTLTSAVASIVMRRCEIGRSDATTVGSDALIDDVVSAATNSLAVVIAGIESAIILCRRDECSLYYGCY